MNWTLYFHNDKGVGTLSAEHQLFASINAPQQEECRWTFIETSGSTTHVEAQNLGEACNRLLKFMQLPIRDFEIVVS